MNTYQKDKCDVIIHGASATGAAAAATMAQIPGSYNVPLVAIEVGMVIALGAVFGIHLTESAAKGIIAGAAGTLVGRGITQFLVGWVPVLGNAVNAATAAGVIEALGWAVANDFANGKNREAA